MSNVRNTALEDIANHIRETYTSYDMYRQNDVWVVFPIHLNTKETRELNRRLGLHKINKQHEKNS